MRRLVLAAALLAAACASPTPAPAPPPAALPTDTYRVLPPSVVVKSTDLENAPDGTRVTLKQGEELKVLLDANPAADTQWRAPKDFAPVLSQIGQRIYINKGLDARYIGTGGLNVFRFRGERPGKVTLAFDFGHLDLASAATRTVRYEVTVE